MKDERFLETGLNGIERKLILPFIQTKM